MRVVQLSDLHLAPQPLYSGIDPWLAWRQALNRVASLLPRPDLLLLTGDLADDGAAETYRRLADSLAMAAYPYALIPGNHDDRRALRSAFPDQSWSHEKLACQRVDRGDFTFLLLDTLIPGQEGGKLGAEHLAWLDSRCPDDRRVILALHHPPFMIGIAGMDAIRCAGSDLLAAWLHDHPHVEAVLCGHVHRPVTTLFAHRPALTAPSTVHQIALQDGPLAWTPEPGGLLVHDCLPGQPLRTHYLPLAQAPVSIYSD